MPSGGASWLGGHPKRAHFPRFNAQANLVVLALLDVPGYAWAEWLSTRPGVGTRRATATTTVENILRL